MHCQPSPKLIRSWTCFDGTAGSHEVRFGTGELWPENRRDHMVEPTERRRIDDGDRAPHGREWEVFVRSDGDDPMQHVGSVRAADPDGAHEIASRLFAWHAETVWVCPSAGMARYTSHDLAESERPGDRPATSAD
jgi:rSAM-partnered protein